MTNRERRVLRVIESSVQPAGGVVAVDASGREELRLRGVARIIRGLVIRIVAAVAIGRQRGVVVVHMTIHAHPRRSRVHAGQRERSLAVIERAIGPEVGVVA